MRFKRSMAFGIFALAWLAAQMPAAGQGSTGRGPATYEEQQQRQAWAERRVALSPLRMEWVSIYRNGRVLRAFVTYPAGHRKAPVVLVGHEVFGLTHSTLNTAVEIAQMGYVTIAPDYLSGYGPDGGGTSSLGARAGDIATAIEDGKVDADINAWARYSQGLPQSNGTFVLVGLSWSGGAAYRYALGPNRNPRLKAVFGFYDIAPPITRQGKWHDTPEPGRFPVGHVAIPIFGFYPENDQRVMDTLDVTTQAMKAVRNRFEPVVYKGADHAFMRVGEDPADRNPANIAAVKAALARIQKELARLM
jgi:carboxymethylenebutenolidase